MATQTLGETLVSSIKTALKDKENGRVVRSSIDVSAIRKKLGMTQKDFAGQFHINLETLKNWEQKKRYPDTATLAYLTCIAQCPKQIMCILNSKFLNSEIITRAE